MASLLSLNAVSKNFTSQVLFRFSAVLCDSSNLVWLILASNGMLVFPIGKCLVQRPCIFVALTLTINSASKNGKVINTLSPINLKLFTLNVSSSFIMLMTIPDCFVSISKTNGMLISSFLIKLPLHFPEEIFIFCANVMEVKCRKRTKARLNFIFFIFYSLCNRRLVF